MNCHTRNTTYKHNHFFNATKQTLLLYLQQCTTIVYTHNGSTLLGSVGVGLGLVGKLWEALDGSGAGESRLMRGVARRSLSGDMLEDAWIS